MGVQDRDWYTERREYPPRHERALPSTVSIALGVAAGILIAGAVGWMVQAALARAALEEAQRQVAKVQALAVQQAERARQAAEQRQAEQRQLVIEQERQRAELVRIHGEQARRSREAAEEHERAFRAFYQPPSYCSNPAPGSESMECANQYIRARRDFNQSQAAASR